jgi:hypothetical protein
MCLLGATGFTTTTRPNIKNIVGPVDYHSLIPQFASYHSHSQEQAVPSMVCRSGFIGFSYRFRQAFSTYGSAQGLVEQFHLLYAMMQ